VASLTCTTNDRVGADLSPYWQMKNEINSSLLMSCCKRFLANIHHAPHKPTACPKNPQKWPGTSPAISNSS
jgi:hypothetical protein